MNTINLNKLMAHTISMAKQHPDDQFIFTFAPSGQDTVYEGQKIDLPPNLTLSGAIDRVLEILGITPKEVQAKKNEALRKHIFDIISDAVLDLTFYDRKEDDELGYREFNRLVMEGVITVDEMVEVFRKNIKNLENDCYK